MPQNKPTQAILINVPTRRRGRIGRTAQKRKAPTETAATLPFNNGASTFLAGEPNLTEANQTIKNQKLRIEESYSSTTKKAL